MNKTGIDWCLNPDGTPGYTWNPITGCLNHTDGMCKGGNFPCYAYRLATTRLKERYLANDNFASFPHIKSDVKARLDSELKQEPFWPRFWEDKLFQPMKARKTPKGIFVCDMSDLFGIGVPEQWTDHVITTIKCCPHHRFYLLTKQPQNLVKFSPFPGNVYLGVTVCNQEMFDTAVYYLKMVEAKVKFLSMEPLLDRISVDL